MQLYEYKVVPAPSRGEKARGIRTAPDRFANALAVLMNRLGQEGWEYLRAETLPAEEREGMFRRATVYHNVLVFRRALGQAAPVAVAAPPAVSAEEAVRRAAAGSLSPASLSVAAPAGDAPRLAAVAPAPPDPATGTAPKLGPAKPHAEGQSAAG